MALESKSEFGEIFNNLITQEEKNILLDLRYLPWTGKSIKPGQRLSLEFNENGVITGLRDKISTPFWVNEALTKVFLILKKYFEKDGRKIKNVVFIQEKRVPSGKQPFQIEHFGNWHNHLARDSENSSIVVFDEEGGATDFIEGTFEDVDENQRLTQEAVSTALTKGKLTERRLPAGQIGHFNKKTIHRRGELISDEPRMVFVIEYEN